MRGLTRSHWLLGLGMLLAIPVVIGRTARADINTTEPGSIIVFPKVVADGVRDTIIHLTNTSNMNLGLHCFYTNAYSTCASDPNTVCTSDFGCIDPNDPNDPNEVCTPFWDSVDFDIRLTAQQPTFWRVSTGRSADLFTDACRMGQTCSCEVNNDPNNPLASAVVCPGITSQPGGSFVAPQGETFIGELRCYEVNPMDDAAVLPMAFNKVKGEAFIETLANGEISAYNAITIQANAATSGGLGQDLDLVLNRQGMGTGEYNACGDAVSFTHHGVDSNALLPNNVTGSVDTEVTLVPCSFIETEPIPVQTIFHPTDQVETTVSLSVDFDCYFSERLSGPYFLSTYDASADPNLQFNRTQIDVSTSPYCWTGTAKGESCDPNDPNACPGALDSATGAFVLGCLPSPGVLGVFEEFYTQNGRPAGSAAGEMYNIGQKPFDIMVVPPGD